MDANRKQFTKNEISFCELLLLYRKYWSYIVVSKSSNTSSTESVT